MYILGIETSCDETSSSVIDDKLNIISNIVFSQQKVHLPYFGVVPELASRTHYEKIHFVIAKTLKSISIKKVKLITYTQYPGLKGALLIGKTVAETLGYIYHIPVKGVDHLLGHIHSLILTHKNKIKYPFISLIISGGHTELSIVESPLQRKILGNTRDDAVGESFDKVAKMLNLSYPGGPVIEKLAKMCKDKELINFPRPYMLDTWDFSFSGIKTAVLYYIKSLLQRQKSLTQQQVKLICKSFQEAIIDTLIHKVLYAVEKLNCRRVGISGGVSANNSLREKFINTAGKTNFEIFFPEHSLTTDNAAMIASIGLFLYREEKKRNIQ